MKSKSKRISTKIHIKDKSSKKSLPTQNCEKRSLLEDQEFLYRREKLKNTPEIKGDRETFELLLYSIIKNEFLTKKIYDESEPESQMKFVTVKLAKLLKRHKTFCHFFYFYHIDDYNIQKIASVIKYKFFEKNKYIYLENDNSTHFYFIVKGKVSFRKKIQSIKTNKMEYQERLVLSENNYFGEWDIVYERKRKLSCFCITDCHLMLINKDTFKNLLEEKILKGQSDKKNFLVKFFNAFLTIPLIKLERFIQNSIETLFFNRNDMIYREGGKNKYLYIIYNGEANLIKNLHLGEFSLLPKFNQTIERLQEKTKKINYVNLIKNVNIKENNSDKNPILLDMSLNKVNYQVVSKLTKGSIGGLEITTGNTEFKYSLISNSDFTTLLKVNLLQMEDEHLKCFMQNLLPIFLQYEKKIHSQIKLIKYIDNNVLPSSCQKYKDLSFENLKNNKNFYDTLNISIDEDDNDERFKNVIHKIDEKFDVNEAGFIKMNDYNLELHKQKNIIKEQLRDNKRKEIKIENFINKYIDEQNAILKYSSVKLLNMSNDNIHQINDIINLNNQNHKRIIYSAKNQKSSIKNWKFSSYDNSNFKNAPFSPFNFSSKRDKSSDNKGRKKEKKITKKLYFQKLQEITDNIIRKAIGQKDYSEMDMKSILKHKLVLFQSFMGSKQKNRNSKIKQNGNFIKEIFLLKKNSLNTLNVQPKKRKLKLLSSSKTNNSFLSAKSFGDKTKKNLYKILNKGKIELNFENDDYVKVVNDKYIKDLFKENSKNKNLYSNSMKTLKNTMRNKKSLNLNIKSMSNLKRSQGIRMIYYDTGQFDMPLASNFSS